MVKIFEEQFQSRFRICGISKTFSRSEPCIQDLSSGNQIEHYEELSLTQAAYQTLESSLEDSDELLDGIGSFHENISFFQNINMLYLIPGVLYDINNRTI